MHCHCSAAACTRRASSDFYPTTSDLVTEIARPEAAEPILTPKPYTRRRPLIPNPTPEEAPHQSSSPKPGGGGCVLIPLLYYYYVLVLLLLQAENYDQKEAAPPPKIKTRIILPWLPTNSLSRSRPFCSNSTTLPIFYILEKILFYCCWKTGIPRR